MDLLQQLILISILVTSLCSMYFSFRSRRSTDMRLKGLFTARMNISLGLMLIFMAMVQMLLFTGSTIRVIVGAVFIVLGLFNLFAGIRNHSSYAKMPSQ